jgi:hypothetical protein
MSADPKRPIAFAEDDVCVTRIGLLFRQDVIDAVDAVFNRCASADDVLVLLAFCAEVAP